VLWVKTERACATCAHWVGKRNTSYSFVEALADRAGCTVDGKWNRCQHDQCPEWSGLPVGINKKHETRTQNGEREDIRR
jgi:hypothetical protein